MADSKQQYRIRISDRAKRALYDSALPAARHRQYQKEGYVEASLMPRVQLSKYVHNHYTDNRSESARASHVFSLNKPVHDTTITLSNEQIRLLLDLALELDVWPSMRVKDGREFLRERGALTALIGSFIDAVACGYLRPLE